MRPTLRHFALPLPLALLAACAGPMAGPGPEPEPPRTVIRINQAGYHPDARKVAVACSLEPVTIDSFVLRDAAGAPVLEAAAEPAPPWGPCRAVHRLDFTAVTAEGSYRLELDPAASTTDPASPRRSAAGGRRSASPIRITPHAYAGAADTLLHYLRQQRSGFNPLFRDSVHHETDAILVDHPRAGELIPVTGGWADAADYLQYGTTSAHATVVLLLAWRDHPGAFADRYGADGLPGANGLADVLDEARWGLEWLSKMYPEDDLLLNQVGDDRDHAFWDLPTTDSSDYGWGRGGYRPVYPCTGEPQGLLDHRNRSDGMASTAGKYAAAFALGAMAFADVDPAFADTLREKAVAAYELGRRHPGVCQTAPGRAPYFYEEENWVDDMELAAAELHALTGDVAYLEQAVEYAAREPVTPWMGRDTARHFQWYPWHNYGHYEVWRLADALAANTTDAATRAFAREARTTMADDYRRGLAAVADRAERVNPAFRIGVPFIWCSNNLVAAFATQALLYRRMTGDTTFVPWEAAARDWLLGRNPWGVSMVIGYPADARTPRSPHSVVADRLGVETQLGGLVDGPVYRSIFENLLGIALLEPDEYAPFNTGPVVYHDDMGDYSTNEPIMDGTANLVYLLSAMGR